MAQSSPEIETTPPSGGLVGADKAQEESELRPPESPSSASVTVFICPKCQHHGEESVCPNDGVAMVRADIYDREPDGMQLVGHVFGGRYQVEKLVGRGGMGWVYRARHVVVGHLVALKVLKPTLAKDPSAVKRFYQEARACSRLAHPNTIKIHDFGATEEGHLFIAMEYLRGRSLKRVITQEGKQPIQRVVHIAEQVCKSLNEAHEKGLIHRDLKPENIYLTKIPGETDFVKVIDFGIAGLILDDERGAKVKGGVVGTPKYMSPEQARGLALDQRSDLYSLGVCLYEMVTTLVPFANLPPDEMLVKRITERIPPVSEVRRDGTIPPEFSNLIAAMLAKNPEDRPENAETIRRILLQVSKRLPSEENADRTFQVPESTDSVSNAWANSSLSQEPSFDAWGSRDSSIGYSTDMSVEDLDLVADSRSRAAAQRSRSNLYLILVVVVLLLGGGIAAILALRSTTTQQAPSIAGQAKAPAITGATVHSTAPNPPVPISSPSVPSPATAAMPPSQDAVVQPQVTPVAPAPISLWSMRLESEPNGADVADEAGQILGQTPLVLERPAGTQFKVRLSKKGRKDAMVELAFGSQHQVAVKLDALSLRKGRKSGAANHGAEIPDF